MMRYLNTGILSIALGLMIHAGNAQTTDGGTVVPGLPNNALTAAEASDGYELLWNGKDFTGWLLNNSKDSPGNPDNAANWAIVTTKGLESGDKHRSNNPDSNMIEVASGGSSVFTKDATFLNFDYKVEWAAGVNVSGNAGLLYYYDIKVSTDNNASAPEYQLCNSHFTNEWKTEKTTAGCNYFMTPLLPSRRNPDLSPSWCRAEGHFNQSRIISFNGHVAHFGNGLRLLEYQKGTPEYEAAYKISKYKTFPIYRTIHPGSFYLQDHGQQYMKFRNVRVKRLKDNENPWGPSSPYLNKTAAAKGDSTLVDELGIDQDLFPHSAPINRYTIVPKTATSITATGDGLSIRFSESGDYTMSIEDVRGIRYSVHQIHQGNQFFLPGRFAKSPRILTIWKDDKKISETVIGRD